MPDAPSNDAAPPHSLGEMLRRAREAKGLELSDVAEVTHVRKEYLKALDTGRYADLPEDVYTRNFLRLYATAVGVDVGRALELYASERRDALGLNSIEERLEAQRAAVAEGAPLPPVDAHRPSARPARSFPELGVIIPTLLLVAALAALAVWGFNRLLFTAGRPPAPAASAPAATEPGTEGADAAAPATGLLEGTRSPTGGGLTESTAPEGERSVPVGGTVFLSVDSEPPGAEVAVDGFALSETTPLTRAPVTAGRGRVVRVNLEGYEPIERTFDLTFDRNLSFALTPVADPAPATAAEGGPGGATEEAAEVDGTITLTITEPTWLEVYASTARNQGERLHYATAQPGQSFRFELPVYVHVGNAAGVQATVEGRDAGPLGSSGAVVSRAFTE